MCGDGWCCRWGQHHARGVREGFLGGWLGLGCRLQPLDLKFPVFQGVDQTFNDGKASRDVGPVHCPNFEVSMCLEFWRTLAERLSQAFTKL